MVEITEEERLAIEEQARQEGMQTEAQNNAIENVQTDIQEAVWDINSAKGDIEFMRSEFNAFRTEIQSSFAGFVEQTNALTAAVEALAVEETVEEVTNKEEHQEIRSEITEQEPPPAVEPKKRKRGWA